MVLDPMALGPPALRAIKGINENRVVQRSPAITTLGVEPRNKIMTLPVNRRQRSLNLIRQYWSIRTWESAAGGEAK